MSTGDSTGVRLYVHGNARSTNTVVGVRLLTET